jgi:hypothetical protein
MESFGDTLLTSDKELEQREQLVQGWMLLADGKVATARRTFASAAGGFWTRFGLAEAMCVLADLYRRAMRYDDARRLARLAYGV